MKYEDLTTGIIKSFYKVYNTLGYGFLEKVYLNALVFELEKSGFHTKCQTAIDVWYGGQKVGFYVADIIVNDLVILELKAGEGVVEEHEAQLTNYLRATDKEIGLLLGFCKSPVVRRKIFDNHLKSHDQPLESVQSVQSVFK